MNKFPQLSRIQMGFSLALLVALFQPLTVAPARADYPDRPIKVIIPFAVGGASDILGRLAAAGVGDALGQRLIVENKAGAGGNLGIAALVEAKADGYTVLFCTSAMTQNPALFRNMPYDPLRDIKPVAEIALSPLFIAVNAKKIPATNLKEFMDYLRKNPGKLNYGAGGAASALAGEHFRFVNDLQFLVVSYDSSGLAATSLLGGETDFVIMDGAPLLSAANSGAVRVLAVAGDERNTVFPQVPTTKEAGLPDYKNVFDFGMYARAGTPADIVQKLNAAALKASESPEFVERFRSLGWTTVKRTPEQFDAYFRAEITKWKDVAVKANIKPLD